MVLEAATEPGTNIRDLTIPEPRKEESFFDPVVWETYLGQINKIKQRETGLAQGLCVYSWYPSVLFPERRKELEIDDFRPAMEEKVGQFRDERGEGEQYLVSAPGLKLMFPDAPKEIWRFITPDRCDWGSAATRNMGLKALYSSAVLFPERRGELLAKTDWKALKDSFDAERGEVDFDKRRAAGYIINLAWVRVALPDKWEEVKPEEKYIGYARERLEETRKKAYGNVTAPDNVGAASLRYMKDAAYLAMVIADELVVDGKGIRLINKEAPKTEEPMPEVKEL